MRTLTFCKLCNQRLSPETVQHERLVNALRQCWQRTSEECCLLFIRSRSRKTNLAAKLVSNVSQSKLETRSERRIRPVKDLLQDFAQLIGLFGPSSFTKSNQNASSVTGLYSFLDGREVAQIHVHNLLQTFNCGANLLFKSFDGCQVLVSIEHFLPKLPAAASQNTNTTFPTNQAM